jgi:hypothetical protein
VNFFFATFTVGFSPNEIFFAMLVHYGSESEILVGIDFCFNETFFAILIHYRSKSEIEES